MMRLILADINSLEQYLKQLDAPQDSRRAENRQCGACGKAHALYRHACYYRKPDRFRKRGESLNPVKILRYICQYCRKTCSVLPECIAARRWHLWETQQAVIQERLLNKSWRAISQRFSVARSTCRRWFESLQTCFCAHADVLRNLPGEVAHTLLHCFAFQSFWKTCFEHISLARAMLLCHRADLEVP